MGTQTAIAIAPRSIALGPIPFNLYSPDNKGRLVLFCRSGFEITEQHLGMLRNSDRTFYITSNDIDSYLDYAQDRIDSIVDNSDISVSDKARLIHSVGKHTVRRLLVDPSSTETIDASEQFVQSFYKLVAGSREAALNMFSLSMADNYMHSHSINVSTFSLMIGEKMLGRDDDLLRSLALAGLLHDIGMSLIDPHIIEKTGELSPEEWEQIRLHPVKGYEIALENGLPEPILAAIRSHHERNDGSGYPDGLTESEIHPFASIVAVADVYDAITSDRSYKQAAGSVQGLAQIAASQHGLDKDAFDVLLDIVLNNEQLIEDFQRGGDALRRLSQHAAGGGERKGAVLREQSSRLYSE